MMSAEYQSFRKNPFSKKFAIALVVVFTVIPVFFHVALAVSPAPYANTVESDRGWTVKTANALGQPDGSIAIIGGLGNAELILDMGAGGEDSGDIIIYYTVTSDNIAPTLSFLDENKTVIQKVALQSLQASSDVVTMTATYSGYPSHYRYVRLDVPFFQAFGLDAVEVASHRSGDGESE